MQAARYGLSVFLDEYNVMDSSVTTSLNPILEGGKIDIPETGETIFPKEGFRVFAACNPNDKGLGFFGRNEEDASNKERFWVVEFGYPTPDQEVPIVSAILKSVFDDSTADSYAQKMVEVANRIRQQYMGESGAADALEVTMSTRTLRRWAKGITVFGGQGGSANPITFTLARALTNNAPRESGMPFTRSRRTSSAQRRGGEPWLSSSWMYHYQDASPDKLWAICIDGPRVITPDRSTWRFQNDGKTTCEEEAQRHQGKAES